MPLLLKSKVVTEQFPASVIDVLSDPPETWSAKPLSGSRDREMYELMAARNYETFASSVMVLAWLSFAGSTLKIVDEETKEEKPLFENDKMTINEFQEKWDMLGQDIVDFIIFEVVFKANPQWDNRPGKGTVSEEKKMN